MIQVLEFIFKDFWHFIGVAILLEIVCKGLVGVLARTVIVNKEIE